MHGGTIFTGAGSIDKCSRFSRQALSRRPSIPKAQTRKPFDVLAEGLLNENSRGDWRSFEPLIAGYVEAVLSPTPETTVAMRVVKLSA